MPTTRGSRVIAHEYFHNWTGNRVTCRDWFQLSLKEGLTVFRDQEFSADMGSRAVKRIDDVRLLRNIQFPEDAGPMAHPVRPDSYVEINNFYTATVYNKGAEVIRMYQALLGEEGFKNGLKLYFERHDGQAVTTDDFLAAMADANNFDLDQLRTWYNQSGTPVLDISGDYDEEAQRFRLHVSQSCPATPGQPVKQPFLIPLQVGLVGPDGRDMPLQLVGEDRMESTPRGYCLSRQRNSLSISSMCGLLRPHRCCVIFPLRSRSASLTAVRTWHSCCPTTVIPSIAGKRGNVWRRM